MTPRAAPVRAVPLPRWWSGPAYGLLGLPLAFVALPLYVVLPHYYATELALPLASVGALLMLVRLLDAAAEPLLGRLSDRLYQGPLRAVLWVAGGSALVQVLGLSGLFFPAVQGPQALAAWMVAGLLVTCLAHSQLVIAHQAWGVRLGGDALQRSRVVAWREGPGLIGVVTASALSVAWGAGPMLVVFALSLLAGWLALWWAPRPAAPAQQDLPAAFAWATVWQPLRQPAFRRLLAVFLCNGIASAVPAALMLFFAQDRLQATQAQIALFLVLYFVSGALSMPGWLRAVRRWGLERAWLGGMLLAVACFGWTTLLDSGQIAAFAWICALSGIALGADLALPGALLARLVERQGAQGRSEGAYLGWWNLVTKLNLALAAGAALPLLQWLGYSPGIQDAHALQRLAWAYALLPCALKLLAAGLLYRLLIHPSPPLHDQGVSP
ncbi:MFS transporter [Diaphorobacter nitroreducens]|uniref:MFS transporter n=1 Tax=Diaphorobacter nitroreducens TaxID=164759 RepID=UPI0028ADF056|nr:MFS transporter [Diaphorobacter nitroreducens]